MSYIAIEQLTFEQEEPAVMIELDRQEIVAVVGGNANNNSAPNSENDVDGSNQVDVDVNVLPILSGNTFGLNFGGLVGSLGSNLLGGLLGFSKVR